MVPSQNWTMEQQGVCPSGDSSYQWQATDHRGTSWYIFRRASPYPQGKTNCCHPNFTFPYGFILWHTSNHWANKETTVRFIKNIIIRYVQAVRLKSSAPDQAALVIYDVSKGHMGEAVQSLLEDKKIFHVTVPNNCTDIYSHWIWAWTRLSRTSLGKVFQSGMLRK